MGSSNSKPDKLEALRLCKERKRLIKQAIDSRYALAAAHVSYTQSLQNIGIALRRFAEAEVVLIESSISTSDKTPSHSSYPSPSPSHIPEVSDSPFQNESPLPPHSAVSRLSYMKSGGTTAVTIRYDPCTNTSSVDDDDSMAFPMPPPPPPPPHLQAAEVGGASWDFFDPSDESGVTLRFVPSAAALSIGCDLISDDNKKMLGQHYAERGGFEDRDMCAKSVADDLGVNKSEMVQNPSKTITEGSNEPMAPSQKGCIADSKRSKPALEEEKGLCDEAEREDPSEYITHRAKDFLSSIKDIEHRFFRASESGKEISRMLEANKIRVGFADTKGSSSDAALLAVFHLVCCREKSVHSSFEPQQHLNKVIIWNRTSSSQSSSSRNPLASSSKDDADDSGSDFVEDFGMISGNHSSTLDRLYAWERKLYDEVKASEAIRKVYDRKCDQLRHQFAKDVSSQVIDKTRAAVKDLHSQIRVALQAIDAIAKRVEKMRDEELQPQLIELVQGFIRMWKAMLESHHAQYITITLAYHGKSSAGTPAGEKRKQILAQLQYEFECFGLSFAGWIDSHASYVDALNGWLQSCIIQPQERSKRGRPFSPRRVRAPPIFVLCRDWSVGIKDLPSDDVTKAIKNFLADLQRLMKQHTEDQQTKIQQDGDVELENKREEANDEPSNLGSIHSSLTKVLDKLTKYSEASLKLYEKIKKEAEIARVAYTNGRRRL